jgi:hypothetical protein
MTIIMLDSSYGDNTMIEQERDRSSYFQKPIVQRWTTPLSSLWCDVDLGRVGYLSIGRSDRGSPPMFDSANFISVFL